MKINQIEAITIAVNKYPIKIRFFGLKNSEKLSKNKKFNTSMAFRLIK